jgi:glutamyl-tRNA synthetase
MRGASDRDLLAAIEGLLPHIAGGDALKAKLTPDMRARLVAAMPDLKERAKTLIDLIDGAHFLFAARPIPVDAKAAGLLTAEARALLAALAADLAVLDPWSAAGAEAVLRDFAERKGVKFGNVAQPLRAALTGRTTSPGIFDVLAVLGKSESLARLSDQAGVAAGAAPNTSG